MVWSVVVEKTESNPTQFVTLDQHMDLLKESRGRCAITGLPVPFHHHGTRPRYWSLRVDHIRPLSQNKKWKGVWAKRNLQIMSRALNDIKGSYSETELKDGIVVSVNHNPLNYHKSSHLIHPFILWSSFFTMKIPCLIIPSLYYNCWLKTLYYWYHHFITFFYWTNKY